MLRRSRAFLVVEVSIEEGLGAFLLSERGFLVFTLAG